jgi:hypothetical protein
MKRFSVAVLALSAVLNTASAGDYLSADEVKALFTDKTFDGYQEQKGFDFKVYSAPDGTHNLIKKGKNKQKSWSVNDDGEHCVNSRCSKVKDAGNGEYHKINNDGEHTHTLTNFRDGNQL